MIDYNFLWTSFLETMYLLMVPMLFISGIGFLLGLWLFNTSPSGMAPEPRRYSVLSLLVNIFRSIPFIILVVIMIPVTRLLVGTMIGTKAAVPALIVTGTPFFARVVENALKEVEPGLIEAGLAMGASKRQIMFKILIREASASLVNALTLTAVALLGYTAMAGTVGGGGLGYGAIRYGLYLGNMPVAYFWTGTLLLIVYIIQKTGDFISKKLNKK